MAADDDLTTNHPVVSHEEWLAARRAGYNAACRGNA
jgi:hypothetical protein